MPNSGIFRRPSDVPPSSRQGVRAEEPAPKPPCDWSAYGVPRYYKRGQAIFHQGADCLGLHIVESGFVGLRTLDSEGNSTLLSVGKTGDVLGASGIFGSGSYDLAAEALVPCDVRFVDARRVRELFDLCPTLRASLARHLAHSVEALQRRLLVTAHAGARKRLMATLFDLAEPSQTAQDGSMTIHLPISRRDLASMAAMKPETLSRQVRDLSNEGLVHFSGRKAAIPDLAKALSALGIDELP